MTPSLQILPLVLLVAVSSWLVLRGMRTKPDNTDNKARGGGSESHTESPH
ncbi:MAG: hypothetical protein KJN60_10015 [Boseongicola sp.]|nr:hypothetical protein [Boseongicola sp.]